MGHPFAQGEPVYDVTFENVQAGLRTDYLFRLANQHGGIVVGTGDLSELALGWCTYGVGDQMSHYDVNAGVPKTLIQYLIRWVISSASSTPDVDGDAGGDPRHRDLARAGPGRRQGETPQSTEDKIGPYALHDFNLYHMLRHGFRAVEDRLPGAARLGRRGERASGRRASRESAARAYDLRDDPQLAGGLPPPLLRASASSSARPCPTARRSAAGGSLSPRGDWRAPSDGNAGAWLESWSATFRLVQLPGPETFQSGSPRCSSSLRTPRPPRG